MTAGPKGDRGERGKTGPQLPRAVARAVVYLFVLSALFSVVTLAAFVHYVNGQRAAQQRAGELVEQKLCATLGKLAALTPPAGNPATNPSRAYEQELHATLDQLGPDIHCGRTTP